MKRVLVLCLALLATTLSAAPTTLAKPAKTPTVTAKAPPPAKAPSDADYFAPGTLSVFAGLGTSIGTLSLAADGGAEYDLGSFKLGSASFTWGAAARADFAVFTTELSDYRVSDFGVAGAGLGMLHFGWNSLFPAVAFVKDLDSFVGLGVGYHSYTRTFTYSGGSNVAGGSLASPGISAVIGGNWFLSPNLAVSLEGGYYSYYSAVRIGALFKL